MDARCALPSKRAAPRCPEAERTAKGNWPASVHAPSPRPPYSTVSVRQVARDIQTLEGEFAPPSFAHRASET
jgi:hypothetical protein